MKKDTIKNKINIFIFNFKKSKNKKNIITPIISFMEFDLSPVINIANDAIPKKIYELNLYLYCSSVTKQ